MNINPYIKHVFNRSDCLLSSGDARERECLSAGLTALRPRPEGTTLRERAIARRHLRHDQRATALPG
jgi:hypothetical protein